MEIIRVNVGGVKFTTSATTLASEPGTLLSKIFNPLESKDFEGIGYNMAQKDEDGDVFFDRDPEMFKIILEYLRNRKVYKWEGVEWEKIKDEATYFGIDSLVSALDTMEAKEVIINDIWMSGKLMG